MTHLFLYYCSHETIWFAHLPLGTVQRYVENPHVASNVGLYFLDDII